MKTSSTPSHQTTQEQSTPLAKWSILIVVLVGIFMSTLDGSIINVSLPSMAAALKVTTSEITFVATSYLLVIVASVLIFGRLGDMIGKTVVFQFGLALFTLGSLLCGVSHSFALLIASRIIQAIGAAATMANNYGIITETFPPKERGKALGLSGTAVALGSLLGPGLGGLIVGISSWEYIFLINLPIGILAFYFSLKLLPRRKVVVKESLDGIGALLFIFSIVPLFLSLEFVLSRGFRDPLIISGIVLSVISFMAFIAFERRKTHPLLELSIFQNKLFSLSIFCGYITFIAIFCSNLILPFYLQNAMGYSPQTAGFILMVNPIFLGVVAPLSGHLSDKIGSELLTFIGLVLISFGLISMSTLTLSTSMFYLLIYIVTMSVGLGMFQSPNNALIMSTVPKDKLGIAGSVNALIRNVGMVSGIALSTTLLYTMMSHVIGERVTSYRPDHVNAFLYGMHIVYLVAGILSIIGATLTLLRLLGRHRRSKAIESPEC